MVRSFVLEFVMSQVGIGAAAIDFLATVDAYPKPDDKIRSTSLKVQGGGNAGNALTCAARLGLNARLISKVQVSWRSYNLMVSTLLSLWKTRTCIHTPGFPPMMPDDLSREKLLSALDGANLVYSDVRLHETALILAEEATHKKIPILVDSERKREGLDELLNVATYIVCSAKFPQEWTEAPSLPSALVAILWKLPNLKFVIVTLGKDGCVMLERSSNYNPLAEEVDVNEALELLKQKQGNASVIPTCLSSPFVKLKADGIGAIDGRIVLGTAERIPPSGLVDTTGAGDAFIGAVLYAVCTSMPPEKMLPFAAQVAGASCRALGARTGLPFITDPCLSPFLW
ncbi:hypothetical protein QQ045_005121 [Rhodiola kirilowii]